MKYSAIPFDPCVSRSRAASDVATELQLALDGLAAKDDRFFGLANHSTVVPGSAGCFGIGKQFPYQVTLSIAVASTGGDAIVERLSVAATKQADTTLQTLLEEDALHSSSGTQSSGTSEVAPLGAETSMPVVTDKATNANALVFSRAQDAEIASGNTEGQPLTFISTYGKWLLLGAIAIAALLVFILLRPFHSGVEPLAGKAFYVTRSNAAVRDRPTAIGSNVVTVLVRGQPLVGIMDAQHSNSNWLSITAGPLKGDFVWGQNVSTVMPPNFSRIINAYMPVTQFSQLRAAPNPTAAIIEVVHPGLRVYVGGEVDGGWMEISLKRGGVGYLPVSSLQ